MKEIISRIKFGLKKEKTNLTELELNKTANELYSRHSTSDIDEYPCLYVGTYRKYNNGSIYGTWVNLSSFENAEEYYRYIKLVHSDEEDPEYMYQDECNIINYSECMSINDDTIAFYKELNELEEQEKEAFKQFIKDKGYEINENTIEEARDHFYGIYDTKKDFYESMVFDGSFNPGYENFKELYDDGWINEERLETQLDFEFTSYPVSNYQVAMFQD